MISGFKDLSQNPTVGIVLVGNQSDYEDYITEFELNQAVGKQIFFLEKSTIDAYFYQWVNVLHLSKQKEAYTSEVHGPRSFRQLYDELQ